MTIRALRNDPDEGLGAVGFPADCGIGGKADDDDSVVDDLEDSGWFILGVPIWFAACFREDDDSLVVCDGIGCEPVVAEVAPVSVLGDPDASSFLPMLEDGSYSLLFLGSTVT